MRVRIPTPLRSYTEGRAEVDAEGRTLAELLADLDRRHPGIRFRMIDEQDSLRPHMRLFVDRGEVRRLDIPLRGTEEILILQALSGG